MHTLKWQQIVELWNRDRSGFWTAARETIALVVALWLVMKIG